jgi:DNA-directed RNA polymerase specialized sigma24 family protein
MLLPANEPAMGRFMTNDFFFANRMDEDEDPAVFHARFWRCHRLLHFIACRVLGSSERVDGAIENCWVRASRNPPRFEYESAFRSWLLRVLIDEALAIHGQEIGKRHEWNVTEPDVQSQCNRTNPNEIEAANVA